MIDSITSPVPAPRYKWTLNSDQQSAMDLWVNNGCTFEQGRCNFTGTSYLTSKISIPLGTYSVRIKCNVTSLTAINWLFDFTGSNGDGSGYSYVNSGTGVPISASGSVYVNSVLGGGIVANKNSEIVITGITIKSGTGSVYNAIGSTVGFALIFLGSIDLIEIYNGTLSASEVSNLYNNRRNVPLSPTTTKYPILDVSARRGFCESKI